MIQLNHLPRSPVKTSDLRGQGFSENRHLLAVRCANMRRELLLSTVLKAERHKPKQVRKLACCKPREPAAVIHLSECQAPVTIEAMPAQIDGLKAFAGHRLH